MRKFFSALLAVSMVTGVAAGASHTPMARNEMDRMGSQTGAPVDYGFGPGHGKPRSGHAASSSAYQLGSVPPGGFNAATEGFFDPPESWPINGLHAVLLPDGRVLSYGTDQTGEQGAALVYDVWNPLLGMGASAHSVLPNSTATDIFCSAQSVISSTGEVLITGGDMTVDGERNYSNDKTTVFSPQSNTMRTADPMTYPRWYPSLVALPNGEMLVLGGRTEPNQPATTPELFNATTGWRVLSGADSATAFSNTQNLWFYPRAFPVGDGKVFIIDNLGHMWSLGVKGSGSIVQLPQQTMGSSEAFPTIMYAPDKLLSLRFSAAAVTIHIRRSARPVVKQIASIDQVRHWANATVLADGRVLVNGGSNADNSLPGIATTQLWDPKSETWSTGAAATIPRLYHSIAMLLPDATVLTMAGGSPGPVTNLNAEIYYPPYLYRNDNSGNPAKRPSLVSAPAAATLGQTVIATVGDTDTIKRVTFVRTGSVTHGTNNDQRLIQAKFTQSGNLIATTLPVSANVMPPGYYMMFVFANKTPSLARIVLVTAG
jgi:hypothetical protein